MCIDMSQTTIIVHHHQIHFGIIIQCFKMMIENELIVFFGSFFPKFEYKVQIND